MTVSKKSLGLNPILEHNDKKQSNFFSESGTLRLVFFRLKRLFYELKIFVVVCCFLYDAISIFIFFHCSLLSQNNDNI